MTELKNRGVVDILIAVVDGLKGFPEAIAAVFPPTIVQTCIVHLIRNSMDFASWKDRKARSPLNSKRSTGRNQGYGGGKACESEDSGSKGGLSSFVVGGSCWRPNQSAKGRVGSN
jgi:hypothetical protein